MWLILRPRVPQQLRISTHTSRVGCDKNISQLKTRLNNFYSHIPCGMWQKIVQIRKSFSYFYSHIPCGMWHESTSSCFPCIQFLLTHPVWDVTTMRYKVSLMRVISTHTSRVGCDMCSSSTCNKCSISTHTSRVGCDFLVGCTEQELRDFYSHIPCGMWR